MTEPCPACGLIHEDAKYQCQGCGTTFRCRSEFSSAFPPATAHRRRRAVLVFDEDGNGPYPEPRDDITCGPIGLVAV